MKLSFNRISAILVGLVFISSAVLKMLSMNGFEIYIYTLGWFSLNSSLIIARLVISTEFLLGLLCIFNIRIRSTLRIVFLLLIIFTIFLTIQYFKDRSHNCYCFGELVALTPGQSVLKNVFLLLLTFFAARNATSRTIKWQKVILPLLILVCIALPFILSPPDNLVQSRYAFTTKYDEAVVETALQNESFKNMQLDKGKKMACFFSTTCQFCKMTASKVTVLGKKEGIEDSIIYIFFGEENRLPQFWEDSHSEHFEYHFVPMMEFFAASGSNLPAVYLIDNGKVQDKFGYRSFDENKIKDFFKP